MNSNVKKISCINALLVDDMGFYKSILTDYLTQMKVNYNLSFASSVKEGLETLDKKKGTQDEINLIICDLLMPEQTGTDMVTAVRKSKLLNHIPFILITSETDKEKLLEALNKGPDTFINKPFDLNQLTEAINLAFRNRGISYSSKSN